MKILHISDLHFEGEMERFYPGISKNLEETIDVLRNSNADFMVITGDLTTNGCVEQSSLIQAEKWIGKINIPYIAIPGNHDLGANIWRSKQFPNQEYYEDVPYEQTNFAQVFKQPPIICKEFDECILMAFALRENDPDNVLTQLEMLIKDTAKPVLLFGHYPIIETRSEGHLQVSGHKDFIPKSALELKEIIKRYNHIKLYACGHVHANTTRSLTTSCLQITAGGLGPGSSVYRLYSLTESKLHFQTLFGGGALHYLSHDKIGSSDIFDYHLGAAEERFGKISLK